MNELAPAVVDAATAICRLQTQIQISTCFSCHGQGKQAMVLEPYASMPCARCHGEGVTHDVPPRRYDAVLTALLDALGGASVERIVERLALLVGKLDEPAVDEPPACEPHRVRVYARKPGHLPICAASHPASCDALPYGEQCWFDALVETAREFRDFEGWPEVSSEFMAHAPAEGEMHIRFEPINEEG